MSMQSFLVKKFIRYKSWKTSQKLVVIESDDWGAERTRDKEALDTLVGLNNDVANDPFTRLDTIASSNDLSNLFEVLFSVKDSMGKSAVLTANVCTANPDFEKIRESGFEDYHFEPFYITIGRKADGKKILELWNHGIHDNCFRPQLHGREHVHALAWLLELKNGNEDLLKAFDFGAWGIPYKSVGKQRRKNLQAALDIYRMEGEKEFQIKWLEDSTLIFKDYFGYSSQTFIPPTFVWHPYILEYLNPLGIRAVQGMSLQYMPISDDKKKFKQILHITGSRPAEGVIRMARNSFFEPFSDIKADWVNSCLKSVDIAFKQNLPAIIGTHRINFVGVHSTENRDRNLKMFKQILNQIILKWPSVRFISSDQLADIIFEGDLINQ